MKIFLILLIAFSIINCKNNNSKYRSKVAGNYIVTKQSEKSDSTIINCVVYSKFWNEYLKFALIKIDGGAKFGVTNDSGRASFTVKPGRHQLEVTCSGNTTLKTRKLLIKKNSKTSILFNLGYRGII